MAMNFDEHWRNLDQHSYPSIFCHEIGRRVNFDECRNCQLFRMEVCPNNKRMGAFKAKSEEFRRQMTSGGAR